MITRLCLILALLGLVAGRALAQSTPDKPWVVGVSDEEQAAALAIFEEGNIEFQAARFSQALAKYSEALKHWDHPAIHFNMAVCLINLDQPLDAKDHLERALEYGEDPIGHAEYLQGLTYRHSLDGQIARVRIACREPGTVIRLDGAYAFTGPGEVERLVLPGKHQVLATKPGFITASDSIDLFPARVSRYDVHLVALKPTTHLEQRWPGWQPWAVGGAGVALAGIGGIVYWYASRQFDSYDVGITQQCPHGCDAAMASSLTSLSAEKHRGYVAQDVAFTLFGLGGAAVIAGAIGIALDQPHTVTERIVTPTVVPLSNGAVMMLGGSF